MTDEKQDPLSEEEIDRIRAQHQIDADAAAHPSEDASILAGHLARQVKNGARLLAEIKRLRENEIRWMRASGCANPETISEALNRIAVLAERDALEGIPDAIERIRRERDHARAAAEKFQETKPRALLTSGSSSTILPGSC
jgi:hypothetical protein